MSTHTFRTVTTGILTIGVDESPPPPFHMGDPNSRSFEGFEVDLTRTIASKLGLTPRYRSELWSTISCDLREGRLDLICTAATVTEKRKEIVDFSIPYFDTVVAITVKRKSLIRETKDLNGKAVGVRHATTAEETARKRIQAGVFRTYHLNVDAYRALDEGVVDAVIDDYHIAKSFESSIPSLKVVAAIPGTKCQYAMMFAKGNDDLRNEVDKALNDMRIDGTYDVFYGKWFTHPKQTADLNDSLDCSDYG